MSLYTDDDLRGFVKYTKDYVAKLEEKPDPEDRDKVEELVRIIITMRFNAMVFESFVRGHSAKDYILSKDLTQLPLHLNDEGLLSQVIIKWRLQNNK
jgi:hypothetical protein